MAELVQLHIENTIPELEQMERIGLFSKVEIKKIIRKRRLLEYTLRRRRKTKEDFLKYIQYELNVLTLIGTRRQRLGCDFKKQEIDHAIATRINKLFKTVILRYQDDVSLWLSQIDFCKRMKWYHSISALFARMLQVHNSNPGLWSMAAKWELEENNAPENARQLLQRALRFHPDSRQLWQEYFRMELLYTDIVRKRREVLGLQERKGASDEYDSVLNGLIASVVYKNATAAIPDPEFAISFIPICQQFEFTDRHIDDIFDDIQDRHPNNEETLNALAKRLLLKLNDLIKHGESTGESKKTVIRKVSEQISSAFEEAVEKVPTSKMWRFYINFCIERLQVTKKERKKMKLRSEILGLFHRAHSADCLECHSYMEWGNLLRANGEDQQAVNILAIAVCKWPKNVPLWKMYLALHIETEKDHRIICRLLSEALKSVEEKESYPLWMLGVQWMALFKRSKLNEFFEQVQSCRDISLLPLKIMYLEFTALQDGIEATRDLCKRLTCSSPLSSEVYKTMIQIEGAQFKTSIEWLRKWYETAIRQYGATDVDLWLDFMKLEVSHPEGNSSLYATLYWRAMKFLKEEYIDEFVTRTTLLSTKRGISTEFQSVM